MKNGENQETAEELIRDLELIENEKKEKSRKEKIKTRK